MTCNSFEFKPARAAGLETPVAVAADVVFCRAGPSDLRLDLYRPERSAQAPLPMVVFIHGGGWHGGEKEAYRDLASQVACRGYLCASVDYRLAGEAPFPAALEDCKCAVRWLRAHAALLGADPDRVAAWGHSAGGHLAALVALTPGRFEGQGGWGEFSSAVDCALCYCAPFDLAALRRHLGAAVDQFLGSAAAEDASPLRYVAANAVPFLVCHGDQDDLVPVAQSDQFVAALRAAGNQVEYIRVPGAGHDLAQAGEDLFVAALAFLDRHLKPPPG